MTRRVLPLIPFIFVAAGSLVLLFKGQDVEFARRYGTVAIATWQFILIGVVFNAGLFFLYRWLLQRNIGWSLLTLHLICLFSGMAIFLYLLLPFRDGQNLDDLVAGLSWLLLCGFLVLIGLISLIILIVRRLNRSTNNIEHS